MDALSKAARDGDDSGFSLVEMAVTLVIVSLLLGALTAPLAAQRQLQRRAQAEQLLNDVRDALYGYAASRVAADGGPHLPCPDIDGDGGEDRSGGACTAPEGDLPWADLGLGRRDPWGDVLRYRVSVAFADANSGFALLDDGALRICAAAACNAPLAQRAPAVFWSRGGDFARLPTQADEMENADGDDDFVSRPASADGAFDDIVVWLPGALLTGRMIIAGRLP